MSRDVPEWIGRDDNDPVPLRVKIRVWEAFGRRCGACTREIRVGDKWTCDHKVALINGGENRESALQPLCAWCEPDKTRQDVAIKSNTYTTILSHYARNLREPKGRPMPGSKRSRFKRTFNHGWVRR